jgi:hypothetical protein
MSLKSESRTNLAPEDRGTAPASSDNNPDLAEHANAIRLLGKRTVENVVEIGRHLVEAKAEAKKCGESWGDWLEREFNWSDQQARRFIHVFEHKSELNKLLNSDFPVSALYLLAAPSTPSEARDAIIERAQAGETVPVAEAKRIIKNAKSKDLEDRERPAKERKNFLEPFRIPSSAEVARREKLGSTTVNKLRGTSLGRAAELDELIELNRGAPNGEHTEIVRALVAAAAAGEKVSALRVKSADADLEGQKRQLEFKVEGLLSEIEDLKAALAAATAQTYPGGEPFIRASETLRRALSCIKCSVAADISPDVVALHEREALNALRALSTVLAGAGIDEVTIVRQYAKEKRCAKKTRRA